MTMTFDEADRIIDAIAAVLQFGPHPDREAFNAANKRTNLSIKVDKKLRKLLPFKIRILIRRTIVGKENAKEVGERARRKAIQSVPILANCDRVQLDAALKIGIAAVYLAYARGLRTAEQFEGYVNASSPMPLHSQGWIKMIDPISMKMYPEWGKLESSNSFAEYCKSVGESASNYWKKIYERIGLEYTSSCPQGNSLP